MTTCSNCKSADITSGGVSLSGGGPTYKVIFVPDDMKFLRLKTGVPVAFYACKNCGLVWSATDPETLRAYMAKHRKKA